MAGHSKWSTIKRKKAATDAKRGKMFTRLLKEIQVAARMGGGSVDGNPRLKTAVDNAKSSSVPGDNIDRAIKRGTGDLEGVDYEQIIYEGYGPGGVAIMVTTLTDNKNRTVAEVRHAFSRGNGSLGTTNSVAFQFDEKGLFTFPSEGITEEQVFEVLLEAGAEDIVEEDGTWIITSQVSDFGAVRDAAAKLSAELQAELKLIPNINLKVAGDDAQALLRLIDLLDDLDDVQDVVSNAEIDDLEYEKYDS
ncbi:MAG: YebC/PmpR family DNA-binding transcriptional regulator [Bdellovibrionota bacterium]